jgi:hypothetical protein
MSGIELLLDDHRGVYIPRDFIDSFDDWEGINDEDRETLSSPDNEWYWEAWDNVLSNATYTDRYGNVWRLHQDGALFAYCEELMTYEEKIGLGFDVDNDLESVVIDHPDLIITQNPASEMFTWEYQGDHSTRGFHNWVDCAADAVDYLGLKAETVDDKTLPLFPDSDTSEESEHD